MSLFFILFYFAARVMFTVKLLFRIQNVFISDIFRAIFLSQSLHIRIIHLLFDCKKIVFTLGMTFVSFSQTTRQIINHVNFQFNVCRLTRDVIRFQKNQKVIKVKILMQNHQQLHRQRSCHRIHHCTRNWRQKMKILNWKRAN